MTDNGTTIGGGATREPRVVPAILGIQALALAIVAVAVFAGAGVGSTALRIGVGALFLVLAGSAAGIALSYAEGQPAARSAALVFEGFALALAVLWLAPIRRSSCRARDRRHRDGVASDATTVPPVAVRSTRLASFPWACEGSACSKSIERGTL